MWLTVEEAAPIVRLSPKTIRDYMWRGFIPKKNEEKKIQFIKQGKQYLFRKEVLEEHGLYIRRKK